MWPKLVNHPSFNEQAASLLLDLLTLIPALRSTPAKALHHPYFHQ